MRWLAGLLATLVLPGASTLADERVLAHEMIVAAPVARVWHAWTTAEGLEFVSAESRVELRTGGAYEWFLDLPADSGGRHGSQGSKVLAWLPRRMLAFAWTFPPDIPSLRAAGETTQVVVLFDELDRASTRVRLYVHGWREGPEWDAGWDYFDTAWKLVLDRLRLHFSQGERTPRQRR